MKLKQIQFPKKILHYIEKADKIQAVREGRSGSSVYKLGFYKTNQIQNLYLKYDINSRLYDRISDEAKVLSWLQKKFKVPEILAYEEQDQMEFLLTKEVAGTLLSQLISTTPAEEIARIYAEVANELHSIDICNCPFDQTMNTKMSQAKSRIQKKDIYASAFDSANQIFTPAQLYDYLKKHRPFEQILVFTHGDLYTNNILIDNNRLSGVIDWARGGYCDYHYDISIILHNIEKYIGKKYFKIFFRYYKNPIKEDIIDYYWKLNEFF